MAANPFDTPQFGAEFFDLYHDNAPIVRTTIPQLPSGGCNYVDLTPGAGGARCGCRRFWSFQSTGSPVVDQAGWCMCNHHACFHDERPRDQPQPQPLPTERMPTPDTGLDLEKLQSRQRLDPLSPTLDLISPRETAAVPGPELISFNGAPPLSLLQKSFDGPFDTLGAVPTPKQASNSMPDTMAWTNIIPPTQPDARNALPPIPAQCLMSQTASTTSSMHTRYLRPFAGKGLQTLSHNSPAGMLQQSTAQTALQESPTQHKTASVEETFVFLTGDEESPSRPNTATTQIEPRVAAAVEAMPRETLKNLADTVGGHAQRLDRLETLSFSGSAHEECQDKYEHMDLRVTELESKVEDIERRALDDNASFRHDRQDDAASPSVFSVSSSAANRPSRSQEVYSQLQSLQAQVDQLQSIIPTWNNPWEVEVVFLPFPLKRLWQHINLFPTDPNTENADDWTQLPMTLSTSTPRAQSPAMGDWPTHDNGREWLFPRACGDKSFADERLRSRGLVKTIKVKAPDARSVSMAMLAAFGNVFRDMQMYARPQSPGLKASKFMGLQSSWVPLRKIHKDSRLRFLSPDEMLTPALWDVQFLASVMMKATEPRLFVTHPDAYLQDYQAYDSAWTWQRLKDVPPAYPDVTESQEVPEEDSPEECWAWKELLDESPNAQPPTTQHRQERHRVSISPSVEYFSATHSYRAANPAAAARLQRSITRSREASEAPFIRTTPATINSTVIQSANPRQRLASRGHSRRSSPSVHGIPQAGVTKRRRARSRSYPRFTPGRTASPTPASIGDQDPQTGRGITPGRGTTPARDTTPGGYATPYSIAAHPEVLMERGSSVLGSAPTSDADDDEDDVIDFDILESSGPDQSFVDENDYENDGDDEKTTNPSARPIVRRPPASRHSYPGWMRERERDIAWPGLEDQNAHHSDGENIDPNAMDVEHESNSSSQPPSEYPSTQNAWPDQADHASSEFSIHQDDN
ncbi:hypothetical protein V8C34DRAFT_98500 [Trichoderma compactum]